MTTILITSLAIAAVFTVALFFVLHFLKQRFKGSLSVKTTIFKIFQFELKINKRE